MAYFMGRQDVYELGGFSTHNYFEFETKADIERLEFALNRLIKNQEMLRAVIDPEGVQRILKEVEPYKISVQDISGMNSEEQDKVIEQIRNETSHAVFDITKYPLFEFKCLKLDNDVKYLFVSYDLMILDSVSASMFIQQLIRLYNYPNTELSEHSYTYRDFINDFSKLKESSLYDSSREYWLSKLDDFPKAPAFNYKVSQSEVKRSHFDRVSRFFEPEAYRELKRFAERNGFTVSAVLLSAYGEALSIYSGMSRLGINLTIFNRYPFHEDIKDIYGDFTSTLLLDYDRNAGETFADRCAEIQYKLSEALDNRYFDGVEFARELARKNDIPVGNPVMPVVFTSMLFEDDIYDEVDKFGELKWSIGQTPQVHLDFQAMNEKGGLRVQLDFVTELFERELTEAIFDKFAEIVDSIAECGDAAVSSLSSNENEVLKAYNDTYREYVPSSLADAFRRSVELYPNNIAVSLGDKSYTYEQLDEISERVANSLVGNGIKPREPVGVFVHRDIDTIADILGILKAGGCYVPLLPDYPDDRVNSICSSAGINVILSPEMREYESAEKVICDIDVNAPAYIIFTSGSTGKPKGVVISNAAVMNTLEDINERFNVTEKDRIIGLSSMCFDLSVYDIFGSIIAGAELVMVADLYDTDNIASILVDKKITIWNSVPSIMKLCTEGRIGECLKSEDLRLVMLSGDWIPLDLPDKISKCFENADIISLGGATEASIWSILYKIDEVKESWKSIPYGYPMANQKIYVLNDRLEDCPFNVEGDIYIGGIGLSDGYAGEKELTEKAFIIHPKYGRIYLTGDKGMFSDEGYVIFLGRKDDQVKINGFRVELGEIEKVVKELDCVENAAALTFKTGGGIKLAVYAVANDEKSSDRSEYSDAVNAGAHKASEKSVDMLSANEYDELMNFMDRNSYNSILCSLSTLGVDTSENNEIIVDRIIEKNNIKTVYKKLICQWLESLCEHGFAERISHGVYRGIKNFSCNDEFDENNELVQRFSRYWSGAFNTYQKMHHNFMDILTGKSSAVEYLFQNGDTDNADTIYRKNPVAEYENNIVSEAVNAYIRMLPKGQKVRILEFGAGTGGTTVPVLEGLETDNVEYVFTDISYFFIDNAKNMLKNYDFVEYSLYNIDDPTENVGFENNNYDIIIGANVLHDAKNIDVTLGSFWKLLKNDGMLIILEITKSSDMIKFSTGFLEGYSSYNDYRLDFDRTLLSADEWKHKMLANGFCLAASYPSDDSPQAAYRQSVIFSFSKKSVIDESSIIEHMKSKLPEYMVADKIIQVKEIPLTSNGKVNKKALPVPTFKNNNTDRMSVEPTTSFEKKAASIWSELLNADAVYIDDNFFDMGGDSLTAIRYISELKELGVNVSIRDVYEYNTIRKLEEHILSSDINCDSSCIRTMRKGNDPDKNIVFIYGGSGSSAIYDNICRYIDPDYNCIGIDYQNDLTIAPKDISIVSLAEQYTDIIEEYIGKKQVVLAGWCVGGVIAAEIVAQLKKRSICVSGLIMLDSPAAQTSVEEFTLDSEKKFIIESTGLELPEAADAVQSIDELWDSICEYADQNIEAAKYIRDRFNREALGIAVSDESVSTSSIVAMMNLFRSFSKACAAYKADDSVQEIGSLYITAAPEANDSEYYWKKTIGSQYKESGISHFEMIIEDNALAIAEMMNDFIVEEEMTDFQKYVEKVWRESLLNLEGGKIGLDTNFFEAGGDSISAIKIVARLKNDGYEIDLPDIYMLDTIRKISDYFERKNDE